MNFVPHTPLKVRDMQRENFQNFTERNGGVALKQPVAEYFEDSVVIVTSSSEEDVYEDEGEDADDGIIEIMQPKLVQTTPRSTTAGKGLWQNKGKLAANEPSRKRAATEPAGRDQFWSGDPSEESKEHPQFSKKPRIHHPVSAAAVAAAANRKRGNGSTSASMDAKPSIFNSHLQVSGPSRASSDSWYGSNTGAKQRTTNTASSFSELMATATQTAQARATPSPNPRAAAAVPSGSMRAGDWICLSEHCGDHNFASRDTCRKCGIDRPKDGRGGSNHQSNSISVGGTYEQQQEQPPKPAIFKAHLKPGAAVAGRTPSPSIGAVARSGPGSREGTPSSDAGSRTASPAPQSGVAKHNLLRAVLALDHSELEKGPGSLPATANMFESITQYRETFLRLMSEEAREAIFTEWRDEGKRSEPCAVRMLSILGKGPDYRIKFQFIDTSFTLQDSDIVMVHFDTGGGSGSGRAGGSGGRAAGGGRGGNSGRGRGGSGLGRNGVVGGGGGRTCLGLSLGSSSGGRAPEIQLYIPTGGQRSVDIAHVLHKQKVHFTVQPASNIVTAIRETEAIDRIESSDLLPFILGGAKPVLSFLLTSALSVPRSMIRGASMRTAIVRANLQLPIYHR
jgi:hypothetical protein